MKNLIKGVAFFAIFGFVLTSAPVMAASAFDLYDTNKDGKITKKEFMAKCKGGKKKCEKEFKWYDRNNDGVITKKEMDAAL